MTTNFGPSPPDAESGKVIAAFRDRFELEGYALEKGQNIAACLSSKAKNWFEDARRAGLEAPVDRNPGGKEAGRRRYYSVGVFNPRAPVGRQFAAFPPSIDASGELFTAYMQPPGYNPDYNNERRFTPLPDALLNDGLEEIVRFSFKASPRSILPNEGRDLLKIGLHLLKVEANGVKAGVSSPNLVHVDGELITFVYMLDRHNVVGGRSLVTERKYANAHPNEVPYDARIEDNILEDSFDTLVIDDRRVAHYVFPVFAKKNGIGWRMVLLIDFTPLAATTSDALLESETSESGRSPI